ncbi:MAG: hypothetical protein L6V93_21985 [Clostridiales bacterium]|nr:MAG: hypothetical protein L6V93_21985 [Clostridiales bacterium]
MNSTKIKNKRRQNRGEKNIFSVSGLADANDAVKQVIKYSLINGKNFKKFKRIPTAVRN